MLDGFRAEKRMLRTEIRNYIVVHQQDLEVNYGIKIPNNVKNMPKIDFEAWLETISRKHAPKILKDFLNQYDCACTNVKNWSNNATV